MKKVISFKEWKRARLGVNDGTPVRRRARSTHRGEAPSGFVTIGVLSAELVRRLMDEE